jgi:hypothetical protein
VDRHDSDHPCPRLARTAGLYRVLNWRTRCGWSPWVCQIRCRAISRDPCRPARISPIRLPRVRGRQVRRIPPLSNCGLIDGPPAGLVRIPIRLPMRASPASTSCGLLLGRAAPIFASPAREPDFSQSSRRVPPRPRAGEHPRDPSHLSAGHRSPWAYAGDARLLPGLRQGVGDGGDNARRTTDGTARLEEGGDGVSLGLAVHVPRIYGAGM